jgi:RimJ/RimL family protein N-acetyltransferase
MNFPLQLRVTSVVDAPRFFEMISSEKYMYFWWNMSSIDDAYDYLLRQQERNLLWGKTEDMYSILFDGKVIGSVWVIRMQHRKHVWEIGYFVDDAYWWKWIATQAVHMIEKIAFEDLWFQRLVIILKPINVASERVAIKAGYTNEWLLHGEIRNPDGSLWDAYIYAKLKTQYLEEHTSHR